MAESMEAVRLREVCEAMLCVEGGWVEPVVGEGCREGAAADGGKGVGQSSMKKDDGEAGRESGRYGDGSVRGSAGVRSVAVEEGVCDSAAVSLSSGCRGGVGGRGRRTGSAWGAVAVSVGGMGEEGWMSVGRDAVEGSSAWEGVWGSKRDGDAEGGVASGDGTTFVEDEEERPIASASSWDGEGGGRCSWIRLFFCLQKAAEAAFEGAPVGGFIGFKGDESAECGRAGKVEALPLVPVIAVAWMVVVVKRGTLLATGKDAARAEGEGKAVEEEEVEASDIGWGPTGASFGGVGTAAFASPVGSFGGASGGSEDEEGEGGLPAAASPSACFRRRMATRTALGCGGCAADGGGGTGRVVYNDRPSIHWRNSTEDRSTPSFRPWSVVFFFRVTPFLEKREEEEVVVVVVVVRCRVSARMAEGTTVFFRRASVLPPPV